MKEWTQLRSVCKMLVITVATYDRKCIQGTIMDPLLDERWSFSGTEQLFRLMSAWLNPDWDMADQTPLPDPLACHLAQDTVAKHTPQARFYLQVLFEQNSTWQGTLRWVEKNRMVQFRSALELIRLMDSALSEQVVVVADRAE